MKQKNKHVVNELVDIGFHEDKIEENAWREGEDVMEYEVDSEYNGFE